MSIPAKRRDVLAAGAAMLALAGCAQTAAEPAPSGRQTQAPTAAEGSTSYPLTLDTPWGSTELTAVPERVAVVSASTVDTDAVLALDVVPVFAPSTVERNPWLNQSDVAAIETRWESDAGAEVSAESVAATSPDLIVALDSFDTFDQERFDRLSAIAPVLYAEQGDLDYRELTRVVSAALDRSARAEEVISATEDAIAETAAAHPQFQGHTAAHVIVYAQEWGASYASSPNSSTADLFTQLGFTLPDEAEHFTEDDAVSDELVGLIDADFLLLSTFGPESDYFVEAPLVQAVPAVAEGRATVNVADEENGINYFAWGLTQQSVLSVPWLIDELAEFAGTALG